MRVNDLVEGDMLRPMEGIYLRRLDLGRKESIRWRGWTPNPPGEVLVHHRWMGWLEHAGWADNRDEPLIYLGHRWCYRQLPGQKRKRRIVREVLHRGKPIWVDSAVWQWLEKIELVDDGDDGCSPNSLSTQ